VHHIARVLIRLLHRPSHPLLVPWEIIHAVVVVPGIRRGGLVKVAVPEQGRNGVLAARRAAKDADAGQVHPRARGGGGLHPRDAVGKTSVFEVLPARVVEGLGAPVGAHAVDLDEEVVGARPAAEVVELRVALGGAELVRAGVDVFENGVFFGRVEVGGFHDDAVDHGGAVAAGGREHFDEGGGVGGDGGALDEEDGARLGVADDFGFGLVDARPDVGEARVVVGERPGVVAVAQRLGAVAAVGERFAAGAFQVDAVQVGVVRVLVGDDSESCDPDSTCGSVDALDLADQPVALGDLVFQGAVDQVVEVEVVPAVALAGPDELLRVLEDFAVVLVAVVDKGVAALVDEGADHAVDAHAEDAETLVAAGVVHEAVFGAGGRPSDVLDFVGIQKQRVVGRNLVARGQLEDAGPVDSDGVAWFGVVNCVVPGLEPIGWGRLD